MILTKVFFVVLSIVSVSVSPTSTNSCGRISAYNRTGRIVGGVPAEVGQFPWQTILVKNQRVICGGALVSPSFIVTAAHCVSNMDPKTIRLVTGALHKTDIGKLSRIQVRQVKRFIEHPKWRADPLSLKNDIALIQVNSSFAMDASTAPVCLPSPEQQWSEVEADLIVSGFGITKEQGEPSSQLLYTQVSVKPNTDCSAAYRRLFDNSSMFCAKSLLGGRDSCQGDSGGPAIVAKNNTFYLRGIVSWGLGCGRRNFPGVYTKVSKYLSWVVANIMQYSSDGERKLLLEQFSLTQIMQFKIFAKELFDTDLSMKTNDEASWLNAVFDGIIKTLG